MATTPRSRTGREVDYPTSDGRPMAETDLHRQNMMDLIETLKDRYAAEPDVYVSGNLLMFYEEGNRRKHVAPDVFVVKGVPKLPPRENFLVWEEGRGPDLVIELTSKTTRREDRGKKRDLYRDVLRVAEYFLFDPNADWLKPSLQGYRRAGEEYQPIGAIQGHFFPSEVLGLNLVRDGFELRLYDPETGRKLPTPRERATEAETSRRLAEAARQEVELTLRVAEALRREAETRRELAEAQLRLSEVENERLRRELEESRRRMGGGAG